MWKNVHAYAHYIDENTPIEVPCAEYPYTPMEVRADSTIMENILVQKDLFFSIRGTTTKPIG
eukprot:c21727_g1_i5 orf=1-183(-)